MIAMVVRIIVAANVVATMLFFGVGMGGAVIVVASDGAFFGLGFGVRIFGALDWAMRGLVLAATLMRRALLLATALLGTVVKLSATPATATPATTPTATPATTAMSTVGIVTPLRRALATTLTVLALWSWLATLGRRLAALFFIGGNFAGKILVFVLVVEVIHARRRGVGRPGGARRGDGLGLAREMLARGQLDIARGQAGQFGGAHDARGLDRGRRADDELRDNIARAGAQQVFDGVGHQFRIDGALRVERHGSLGRSLGIGPGVNRGGTNAVATQLVKKRFGEMVQTTFNSRSDGTAGSGAIAIPAEDDEMALLLAQPRKGDAREGNGCEQADVEALGHVGHRGVEQRRRGTPGGVNDKTYMSFASNNVLGHLGEGGGVSEVARDGEKVVVREGITGELGGECIHPAAHADQAPGDSEPRPGVGAGD